MSSEAVKEGGLFFRQWMRAPRLMGSVIPSSKSLARAVAQEVRWQPGQHVIELGGGTGSITQGMIDRGIPEDRLIIVELGVDLFGFLRDRFSKANVIHGDATKLDRILADLGNPEISTVISGLPMVGTKIDFQRRVIDQAFAAMPAGGDVLQYSYSPISAIRYKDLNLHAEMAHFVPLNFPPAFVWRYRQTAKSNG